MTNNTTPRQSGDLTEDQVLLLVEQFAATLEETRSIIDVLTHYALAGGRDWRN